MHVGLVMECDYREGRTQEEAFAEAMSIAEIAETQGLDGVWLAERHFAMHRRPTDPMGAGIPSIASVPLVLAAAIAARTTRLRIGTGVSILPLCHPIRTAEEAATVDQISHGRLDFGVGRSGFPRAYSGYGVRYDESRDRFAEPGRGHRLSVALAGDGQGRAGDPGPDERAARYFEAKHGLDTIALEGFRATDAYAIGQLGPKRARDAFARIDRPEIEVFVVPGGNFPTMSSVASWEREFKKPVVTTNQASIWAMLPC